MSNRDATQVRLGAKTRGPSRRGGGWWALPRADSPRLLVPTHAKGATKCALRFVSTRKNRILLRALLLWKRVIRAEPDWVEEEEGSLSKVLSKLFPDTETRIYIYRGTDSIFVKDTLQIVDNSTGEVLCYGKSGRGIAACASIDNEAKTLQRLANEGTLHELIPRILYLEQGLSLQTPGPDQQADLTSAQVIDLSQKIFQTEPHSSSWQNSPVRERIAANLETLEGQTCSEVLTQALDFLDERLAGRASIAQGRSHGDFVAWNLRQAVDGTPFVFDWEWSSIRPAGYDLWHYHLVRASFIGAEAMERQVNEVTAQFEGFFSQLRISVTESLLVYLADQVGHLAASAVRNGDQPAHFSFVGNYVKTLVQLLARSTNGQ